MRITPQILDFNWVIAHFHLIPLVRGYFFVQNQGGNHVSTR